MGQGSLVITIRDSLKTRYSLGVITHLSSTGLSFYVKDQLSDYIAPLIISHTKVLEIKL